MQKIKLTFSILFVSLLLLQPTAYAVEDKKIKNDNRSVDSQHPEATQEEPLVQPPKDEIRDERASETKVTDIVTD
jgi:hypothetical protein